ncbi:glycosyltransferase family 4 protein [Microvirga sp. 2MCAF35]|uniref:glycosyltransferase family 4 protein n=1 Tax=Microvirga sp. 2MCAF35 TaxID=3232987 RepID=UPI003F97DAC5
MTFKTKPAKLPVHQTNPSVVLHYWGRRGGGSDVTRLLARHLSQAAEPIEVTLSLARQNSDMAAFEAIGLPIETFDRPGLSTLWRDTWLLPRRLRRHADKLAELSPAAVIVTMNAPFTWPFTRLLQKRGLKVIYVAHDAEPHPGDYAATWQRLTQDMLIKSADEVVTLSSSVVEKVAKRIPGSGRKTTVIPLETIYPTHRPSTRRTRLSHEPVRLLFYGRLLPYKGLTLLAQALKPFRQNPMWRLTVAGSGPLEADVKKAFADWPQVDLRLGWVSHEETAELFSTHDLLLCPYVEASQSGVIAQAMSWGLPSLVMPTGALPEQIGFGRAGLVADAMDPDSYSKSLNNVLSRPECVAVLSQGAALLLAERQASQLWIELIKTANIDRRIAKPQPDSSAPRRP